MIDRNLVAALLTWCLAVLAGCGQAEVEPVSAVSAYPPTYSGQTSIEERIINADVVARVRMVSVEGGVGDGYYSGSQTLHTPVMRFRFRVLEYLKGSGGSEIVGVVPEHDSAFATAAEARAMIPSLLSGRDTRWDDREAVVFLVSEAGGYRLGYVGYAGDDSFTVASRWSKKWLPEATATSPQGASGASGDKRFLLDDPSSGGASGAQAASGASATAPTITLSALKVKVAELQSEIDAGGGSEEYRTCLAGRYFLDRVYRWKVAQGKQPYRFETYVDSGMPAGSQADKDGPWAPTASGYWLGGRDKDLFTVVTTTPAGRPDRVLHHVVTARPLPAGEYRMNFHVLRPDELICGGWSEFVKNTGGYWVRVTAPAGTVHEAFFDPVAIGNAVGADGSNGVLKPAAFTVGGASATITGLEWEAGVVHDGAESLRVPGGTRRRLHRPGRLGDHHPVVRRRHAERRRADVDRGGPALERRRPPDAAHPVRQRDHHAADGHADTHANGGAHRYFDRHTDPGGDTHAYTDGHAHADPTPEPTPTLTPTPTPTTSTTTEPVTVTLIPRVNGLTFFDIDIQWSHSGSCDNYYVAIITDANYQISFLGFHPPETSSHYVEGGWLYDNVPDFWVVVECRASGDSQEVGRASLRAAHPDNN